MARPLKEGLDYFPHDCDLSNDEKIEAIEAIYGNDGYAVYLKILERVYRAGGKLNISAAETQQILSKKFNISSVDNFLKIVESMVNIGLWNKSCWKRSKTLTSNGVIKRSQIVVNKRIKMKERYEKKVSDAETTPETRQSKVKESKVKESKVKYYPPENASQDDPLKTIDEDIKNFKSIGMTNQWIKDHYLTRKVSEVEIDLAMGRKF